MAGKRWQAITAATLLAFGVCSAAAAQDPAQAPPPGATMPAPYTPKSAEDVARSDSEFKAMAYLRTVLTAQREYRKKRGHYAPSLLALAGGARSFTKRMARTDRGDYLVGFRGGKEGFSLTLTPKVYDAVHRAFYMDSSGVIRAEEGQPATAQSPAVGR